MCVSTWPRPDEESQERIIEFDVHAAIGPEELLVLLGRVALPLLSARRKYAEQVNVSIVTVLDAGLDHTFEVARHVELARRRES